MPPVTIDGTSGITTPMYGGAITANAVTPVTGFKSRIINGACVIDQRNAGASVTPTSNVTYTLDRWVMLLNQSSKFSVQQNAGSVTPPAGFTNYMGFTSTSAYTVGAGEVFGFRQSIEGYNIADLNWGTANAKTVTLSFWVRSSLTGTFGGAIKNIDETRAYPFSYTISAANTWEQKSITIAGDTTGTWNTTNSIGISIVYSLGVGATLSGTAGAWTAGNLFSATGATSVVGTNGATFYITGVQLEVGSTATSFDYRPYGTELALCQRYFAFLPALNGPAASTTQIQGIGSYPVTMRASPTVSATGVINITDCYTQDVTQSVASVNLIAQNNASIFAQLTNFAGLSTGRIYYYPRYQNSNLITLSAEL